VTAAEIALLRSLAQADVVTFMPEGQTAAALARYEATLERLREMQKAGWIELEVAEEKKRRRGRHRPEHAGRGGTVHGAGQEALRLLGGITKGEEDT